MKSNFTKRWSFALSFLLTLCVTVGLNAQTITITAPASVAGDYPVKPATFGPAITAAVSGNIILGDDADDMGGTTSTSDACEALVNDLTGAIALVDRGACGFTVKAINAQTAGAALVIVCNSAANAGLPPIIMGGDDMGLMTVPSVMMSYDNCEILKAELGNGLAGMGIPFTTGEDCSNAIVVGEGTHTAAPLTAGGSLFNDATSTAWYSYTPAMDGLVNINSCLGGADTRMYVWTDGCDLATIVAQYVNDDACDLGSGDEWASELNFLGSGGTQYWISWDDRWDASGFDFNISLGPVPMVDVTVTVDMSNEMVAAGGAHIAGEFNGWAGEPMTDNMDGTYSFIVTGVTAGDTIEYKFQNGLDGWENDFDATTTCGLNNNRFLVGGIENSSVSVACFNSCDVCPPPACTDPAAIICDDFENYTLSDISGQAAHWTPWGGTPGAADDATVSDAFSTSGMQSLLVSEANGDDMLLLLGNQTTGNYLLTWKMYVPMGSTGYFNVQKTEVAGEEFGMQTFMNDDGTATIDQAGAGTITYNYTQDAWINMSLNVDLTNDWTTYMIDGAVIGGWPASDQALAAGGMLQLGAINFFGNTNTVQYIDDVLFKALPDCPADAVICDGLEAYAAGSTTGGQAPWWTTWSGTWGTAEDGIVSDAQAFDGNTSMLIGNNEAQDVLLLLGNRTSGNWRLEMQMYVSSTNTGYYNIQNDETPGLQWNMEAYFNTNAAAGPLTPGMGALVSGETYTHPEDAWFPVVSMIDLDNGTHTFMVDGVVVLDNVAYAGDQIGAIDFFSAQPIHNAYFDAIRFIELDPILPDPVDVTFNVNMEQQMTDPTGAFIAGEMNAWAGEAMTDNGDDTYTMTFALLPGDTIEYKFQNGLDGWEDAIPDDCTLGGFGNRYIVVGDANMDVSIVCFDQCIDCFIATDDLEFNNAISIFPNPTADFTTINYDFNEANDLRIDLNNSLGQLVSTNLLSSAQVGTHKLDVSGLPTGIYFIQITNGENAMVEKLIVE